jgi:CreA protein
VAEDTSDASLACRQIGPVTVPDRIAEGKEDGEDVFKKRTSLLTKTMQVVRFYDAPRNTLVYLTYSDRIIEGSPKNAISVVVIEPWTGPAGKPASNDE